MKPRSPAGVILIMQMATLSVRMKRAVEHESAAIARNVRHAADAFDEERIDHANTLFEALGDDPRNNLRKLRKSPEGIDRLIDAWRDLRADLAIEPKPVWTAAHLEEAANLTGLKTQHARARWLDGVFSRGVLGRLRGPGRWRRRRPRRGVPQGMGEGWTLRADPTPEIAGLERTARRSTSRIDPSWIAPRRAAPRPCSTPRRTPA